MILSDIGKVNSSNPYLLNKSYITAQSRLNYQYKFLGLNLMVQYNPFYLIQEPSPWQSGSFRQYSLGPALKFSFFQDRIKMEASNDFSYFGYDHQGWTNTAQCLLSFQISRVWRASAQVFYVGYTKYPGYNLVQGQISVTRSFLPKQAPGFKTLSLTFFGDENANGIWDLNENPLEDVVIALGGVLAQTNKKGKLSFSNLQPSSYQLQVQKGNGWWLMGAKDITVVRNEHRNIGLVKAATVFGKIIYDKSQYLEKPPNLEGVKVVAKSKSGELYSTITEANGSFRFLLPVTYFSFSIHADASGLNAEHSVQSLQVQSDNNPELIFKMEDGVRKVQIQQF